MPVRDRLTGRIRPIRIRRVNGIASNLRQIAKPQPLPLPWAELAPLEHAPLPVKACELHCSKTIFGARPYYDEATAKRCHSPGTRLSS
jgi:hypothetical protein